MAVKEVELPLFDGCDPVGRITRAETYFEVQWKSEEVKIRLAKLSMEGTAIHYCNLLHETEDTLTWGKLKQELVERYGERRATTHSKNSKICVKQGMWRNTSQNLSFSLLRRSAYQSTVSWLFLGGSSH